MYLDLSKTNKVANKFIITANITIQIIEVSKPFPTELGFGNKLNS